MQSAAKVIDRLIRQLLIALVALSLVWVALTLWLIYSPGA
jgi:hypothetical protein